MGDGLPGLRYRPDLEGLRAVAILLVIAAHAGVPWLAGGFIGVDVFFVLSGYLITGLLVEELRAEGRVRFARFYARRLRRLLPALLVMLLATGAMAAWLLPYGEQVHQARAGAAAALWLSNLYFAFARLDYFGPAAETNLFLHTWSLGVEEQFYLVWPALLLLVFRSARGDTARAMRRLTIGMVLVFTISLAASVVLTELAPRFAFYMMPARAWQFALGAMVFLWLGEAGAGARMLRGASWAGWGGLAVVLGAAVLLHEGVSYPGIRAVAPTLGAALVIAAGTVPAPRGAARLLAIPPMQAIGRISYAWYLWHWPVLLLGVHAGAGHPGERLGLALLSLVLAAISTHGVEMPIRRGTHWALRPGAVLLTGIAVMVASHLAGIRWHNAASRLEEARISKFDRVRLDLPAIYALGCDDGRYEDTEVRVCTFGADDAPNTAVVMGDSVALQWFPALERIFADPDWQLAVVTKSSCPMVDAPIFYRRIGRIYTECEEWRRTALKAVAAWNPEVVILGSGDYAYTEREWKEGTARVLEALAGTAGRIYILAATPALPFDGPRCLASGGKCAAPARDGRVDDIQRWIREAAEGFAGVRIIDMNDLVCPGGECRAEREGRVVYRDSQHLTATFVASLSDALASRLDLPRGGRDGVPPLVQAE